MKIYKYELGNDAVEIPLGEILDVQIQDGKFVLWALVNPNRNRMTKVYAKFLMTGQEITIEENREYRYFKTLVDSMGLVWHVFLKKD